MLRSTGSPDPGLRGRRRRSTTSRAVPLDLRTAGPFRASAAVREGRLTPGQVRGPAFRPLFHDVRVGADTVLDAPVLARALAVWGGPGAVIAGSLAARVLGVETPDDRPEIVVSGARRRPPPGVLLRRGVLPRDEVTVVDGLRVTTPARTAFDLARRLPLPDAVAAADALAHRRPPPDALRRLVCRHAGDRHVQRVREVVALTDARAESLPESRLRVGLVLRGVPRPDLQVRVVTPLQVYRLDLGWRRQRLALEYDGEEHRDIRRHGLDLDRDAALADEAWYVVRVTKRQLDRPDALAARVMRLLAERS